MTVRLNLLVRLLLLSMSISFLATRHAGTEPTQLKQIMKEISGEVSCYEGDFISIVYKKEQDKGKEYEMMFAIDKDVILEGMTDPHTLNEQDIIKIEYVEIEQGGKSKRVAKKIILKEKKIPSLDLKGFKE